jgi:autotransporter-associated beta strand protein
MPSSFRTRRLIATAAATFGLFSFHAANTRAADTWDNSNGNAGWSTATNWADNSEPLDTDDVVFPLGQPGGASTISLGAGEFARSLTFNDNYLLNGDTLTLAAGGEVTVAVNRTATLNTNLAGGSAGSNGLTKLGPGTLILSSHTFVGQVEVTQGILSVAGNFGLGNVNNNVLLNGGTLVTGTFTTSRQITVGGAGGALDAAIGHTLTLTQPLTGPGSGPLTLTSSAVGGSTGNRTIVLANAASNRTGQTIIEQGTVRVSHGGALGSGNVDLKLNGALDLVGCTVDVPMALTGGTLQGHGGNSPYAGTITVGSGNTVGLQSGIFSDTLTVGNGANDFTGGGFNTKFAKTSIFGAGRVRLAQPNNYQGDWQVNSGILTVGHNNALGTGTTPISMLNNSTIIELENGVTLDRNVNMPNTTALIGAGSSTFTGTIKLDADATVNMGGAATKIALGNAPNDVTGGGATAMIRKTGPGALEFTQRSNLQAGLTIWQGTVQVKPGAQIAGGNGTTGGASSIRDLDLQPNTAAKLDLTSTSLVIKNGATVGSATGGAYTGVSRLLQLGANGGAWDGATGIATSSPDASNGLTAIGVATAAQAGYAGRTFQGVSCDADDVILMYTYAGDANLDGIVSGDDYSAIDFSILVPGTSGWYNGDFNYDGFITGDDYSAIDFGILAQGAPFPTGSPSLGGVGRYPSRPPACHSSHPPPCT